MTKFPVIYFEEDPIIKYLRHYGHGPDSKDYELAISVWIKRLYEKNANDKSPYCIAFELKEELGRTNPNFDPENLAHVKDVLENKRRENTPIDFILAKGKASSRPNKGWGLQLKRFGRNVKQDFEQALVDYINKLLKRHQPGEAGLVVIPEADKNLQPVEIQGLKETGLKTKNISRQIKTDGSSYKLIKFLHATESKIFLTELWPKEHTLETTRNNL